MKTIENAVKEDEKSIKGVAVPVRTFLNSDEYVKKRNQIGKIF